jgi:hypothetical protein
MVLTINDPPKVAKVYGKGYCKIPLFAEKGTNMLHIDLFKGTPRDLVCDPHLHKVPPKANYSVFFETDDIPKRFNQLSLLVPELTLVGQNDEIPGLKSSYLPSDIVSQSSVPDFSPRKTLCLHGVRLENG